MADVYVSNGQVIRNLTVSYGEWMRILSGGTATATTVSSGGWMRILSGGTANATTVSSGGRMQVDYGTATATTVSSGGRMQVDYGTATATTVSSGGTINGFTLQTDTIFDSIINGAVTVSNAVVYGYAYVSSGGTATQTAVSFGGSMTIYSGGTANATGVSSGGRISVLSGGRAMQTEVSSGGSMAISSGGTATETEVSSGGRMDVFSGGTATETTVSSGGTINGFTLQTDTIFDSIINGAVTVSNAVVRGSAFVQSGGTANATEVSSGGWFVIGSGGTATKTAVSSGGWISVLSGGVITGKVKLGGGMTLEDTTNFQNGRLNFQLQERKTSDEIMLSDMAKVLNASVAITVSASLASGTYRLAGNADGFYSTVSLFDENAVRLGYFERDEILTISGRQYLLSVDGDSQMTLTITKDDDTAPGKPAVFVDITAMTNQNVTVFATFSADSVSREYSLDSKTWLAYTEAIVFTSNGTVYFRGTDAVGNISEVASYKIGNIDKTAPVITLTGDNLTTAPQADLSASTDDGSRIYYSLANKLWTEYVKPLTVRANAVYYFKAEDAAGNIGLKTIVFDNIVSAVPQNPTGSSGGLSWSETGAEYYIVEYSTDNFSSSIGFTVKGCEVDFLALPKGSYQWRVRSENDEQWAEGSTVVSRHTAGTPELVQANTDGIADLFFVNKIGVWTHSFFAKHAGSKDGWNGTDESVQIAGNNRFGDIFEGCADANILYLTDDSNGDALFMDDIFSALPDGVAGQQARLANIDEIRAGAGNDVIDFISQRFAYTGDGLTIRGGDGDDTIWANKGDNLLFGDAGNDRITGGNGNDVICGGNGNDFMHGGGGDDVFTFGGSWGNDTIRQLAGAGNSVTLWFDGLDADDLAVSDADGNAVFSWSGNSVTVENFASPDVVLKFGDDGSDEYGKLVSLGAFEEFSTRKIFESDSSGILAAL